jgi:branched-chain amino acid transport system permease protein
VVGGLLVGVAEQLSAGLLSSKYKDAVAFLVILATLLVLPNGLFGRSRTERV